jgi:hypothetical protein
MQCDVSIVDKVLWLVYYVHDTLPSVMFFIIIKNAL